MHSADLNIAGILDCLTLYLSSLVFQQPDLFCAKDTRAGWTTKRSEKGVTTIAKVLNGAPALLPTIVTKEASGSLPSSRHGLKMGREAQGKDSYPRQRLENSGRPSTQAKSLSPKPS